MMPIKKLCFLLVFLFFTIFHIHAQFPSISKSSPIENLKTDEKVLDKVTTADRQTYVVRLKTGIITIDHYNEFLMLVKSNKFTLPKFNGYWPSAIRAMAMEDKLVIFAFVHEAFCQDFIALPVNFASLEPGDKYTFFSKDSTYIGNRDYLYSVSPDRKWISVASYNAKIEKEPGVIGVWSIFTMNSAMEIVAVNKLPERSGKRQQLLRQITVLNSGDVLTTVLQQPEEAFLFQGSFFDIVPNQQTYQWWIHDKPFGSNAEETNQLLAKITTTGRILRFSKDNSQGQSISVTFPGKFMTDLMIRQQEDGKFTLAGFYSDKCEEFKTESSTSGSGKDLVNISRDYFTQEINGVFAMKDLLLDKDITISEPAVFSSPIKFTSHFRETSRSKRSDKISRIDFQLFLEEIRNIDNEHLWIVGELKGDRGDLSYGLLPTEICVPINKQLYFFTLDLSGHSVDMQIVQKNQLTQQEPLNLLSYATVNTGNNTSLFYNEFVVDSMKTFNAAMLLTTTHKNIHQFNFTMGNKSSEEQKPVNTQLADFWVFVESESHVSGTGNILLFYNAKGYKLVRFD